jgi:hypothetical protein
MLKTQNSKFILKILLLLIAKNFSCKNLGFLLPIFDHQFPLSISHYWFSITNSYYQFPIIDS